MAKCKDHSSGWHYGTMTWTEQRRQYARLMNAGYTPEQAKEIMPRCQKCLTSYLRAQRATTESTQ